MTKTLMTTILDAYTAAHPSASTAELIAFCAFTDRWLAESNIVGVGQTTDGVSICFGDGTETQLTVSAVVSSGVMPAIPVTGTTTAIVRPDASSTTVHECL